ncbi:gas vesicle protein GvpL [Natronolimnohabitans innermongolicus]|uniref:Gas vesicle synthesis protein GvpLGvpF n=1 Tax=Natronolimnohabitans innermongolicus JCM 12255 TaxID=1227499 RepID=L9WR98_9EURY|nr:GvpL/GvpF family gas vesicle protein [Natronolimnohabitans innermongolicus]ELY51741.1 gas vesicle synthesis protein GvpLGvpF [Natronolimnohabitans innermongolicus JCM 12255]
MSSEGSSDRPDAIDEIEEIDDLEDADADALEAAIDEADLPEIEDGRYLYCLVRLDDDDRQQGEGTDASLETTGVDGEPVSVIVEDGLGAVVHATDGIYDSGDLAQIRRWLVRHQTVVDEAGEAFGTPIPFQFDTILRGGDAGVRQWLREESTLLERALSELANHWEYRVEVVEIDPIDDDALVERDERLRELAAKIDGSGEGTAFLLEKKFDQRLTELRAARRESITADLRDRLDEHAREVHALERSPSASLADDVTDAGDDDGETLCRLTLLAHEDAESEIGSVLDDVAANDGLEVRFTGPWPPYTFAPELGGDGSSGTGEGGPAQL